MLKRQAAIAFFVLSAPAAALANSPGQGNATGEFVTTCVGLGTGGGDQGGGSIYRAPPNYGNYGMFASTTEMPNCNWSSAAITGGALSASASKTSTFAGYTYSGSAQASVTAGVLHLQSNVAGPSASYFPIAVAQGGWTDSITMGGSRTGPRARLS